MTLFSFLLALQENEGLENLIPAYFTLIAAGIGAIIALATQFISSKLTTNRERTKLKVELVAEERSQAYLLSQYNTVFIEEIVLSKMNLRLARISFELDNKVDNAILYKTANEALDRAQEIENKMMIASASYFKVITHFTNLTKKRKIIINLFDSLKDFEKPNFSFEDSKTINELTNAREKEIKRLKEAYNRFPKTYNQIFEEMKKSI